MQEAILQLIEAAGAGRRSCPSPLGGDENAELHASGYYSHCLLIRYRMMFSDCILSSMRRILQRWHKPPTGSKGCFAMLNLVPGKQLCETLEHLIRERDASGIEKIHQRH